MTNQRRVVVVGSGAAGLAAAIAAASSGADVTVLEAAEELGGTTAWSGGGIWIPANDHGAPGSREEQVAAATLYLKNVGIGDSDAELQQHYIKEGRRVIQASEEKTAVRWHEIVHFPDYHSELPGGVPSGRSLEIYPVYVPPEVISRVRPNPYGNQLLTIYANQRLTINEGSTGSVAAEEIERRQRESLWPRGRGLVGAFVAAVLENGGRFLTGTRVQRLITSGNAVIGVEANGQQFEGQVVIASGGFEHNSALVRSFLRGPMLAPGGVPTNQGDGLRMGMQAGAALANMSEAFWAPGMEVPGEVVEGRQFYRMMLGERIFPGSIVVDGRGKRFADESVNYNDFGRSMHEFDPGEYTYPRVPSWYIFDSECRSRYRIGPLDPNEPDPDWLTKASSLEELAEQLGMPPAALQATVERFNRQANAGVDDDYGRGSYPFDHASASRQGLGSPLRALTDAPFYAIRVLPGCVGTRGGLKTNGHGQVLRADGSGVIPGLFAAGNAAASPFGHAYPGGGSTIGPALVFGWCAGETAASSP